MTAEVMNMNADEMTDAEWDALTERERNNLLVDHNEAYLAECSAEDRARVEWENS